LSNYDRIATIYDIDMGRNMAFDDVAFYVDVCRGRGRVLELGCGNGRILLELVASGIDAVGVDASERMLALLRAKAAARGLAAPALCRMDIRALGFSRAFDVVLCPYSLVTYLVEDSEFARMAEGVREALHAGGTLVVDAFVPRPVAMLPTFTLDYRRPHGEEVLVRWKRITALDAEHNRIERRYERFAGDGRKLETIELAEDIRPLGPDALRALLAAHGYAIEREWWNYAAQGDPANAQFFTVAARPR